MKIGILGAMHEEVSSVIHMMCIEKETTVANRVYYEGTINDMDVVVVFSRWGKVASASTTATLINLFNVDYVFFTGVAGAVNSTLNIGDIVIANGLYQHDMDARPFFDQFQIPLTNTLVFRPRPNDIEIVKKAVLRFIDKITISIDKQLLENHAIYQPVVHTGLIASGDKFIANPAIHVDLNFNDNESTTLAVDMESAAVAQICEDYQIPYLVVRTISDKADHAAPVNFQLFIKEIASSYAYGILKQYLSAVAEETFIGCE